MDPNKLQIGLDQQGRILISGVQTHSHVQLEPGMTLVD